MESRRNATAGIPFWTPAPVRTSPTSTETSDNVWEGEEEDDEEEQAGSEDGFASQMDENGIVGLFEALRNVESGEPLFDLPGSLTPRGCLEDTQLEEESCSQTESVRQEPPNASSSGSRLWTEDVRERTQQQSAAGLDGTDEEEEVQTCDAYKQSCTSGEVGVAETGGETSPAPSCGDLLPNVERVGVSEHKLSRSVPAFSHLLHFTPEEFASAPGIDAETFPEMSFSQSLPNSYSSHKSLRSSSCLPPSKTRTSPQVAKRLPEQASSSRNVEESESPGKKSDKQHKPPHNLRTRSHEDSCRAKSKISSVESKQRRNRSQHGANQYSRTGALVHRTPDLSKVEAKVHFPKRGYKPPKSRLPKKTSLAPEAPIVFKSPADIVKEVLLNSTDKAPAQSSSVAIFTMPQDFRSRQQATSLLEQLQEGYNTLLTKYAAAENTIDRLRLEAKVNLYSDPPTAGECVPSAVNHDALKFIQLGIPRSGRAEVDSADLPPNEQSTHQGSYPSTTILAQLGQQLSTILLSQADGFLQQLQTFENLLKNGKLKSHEQVASLSHLAEGLDSLERSYLLTRDEYKLLLQRGEETSLFDPDRELEDLVFQCGLHLEALKEEVDQKLQEEQSGAPPSPYQPTTPFSLQWGGTPPHPQSPLQLSLHDRGETAELDSRSLTEDDEEEERREKSIYSFSLKLLKHESRRSEPDLRLPFDLNQLSKNPAKPLMHSLKQRVPVAANLLDFHPRDEKLKDERGEGETKDVQKSMSLRKVKLDHFSSLGCTIQHHRGVSLESPALSQSIPLTHPGLFPRSRRRLEDSRSPSSSLSSLGDVAAPGRRSSKTQSKTRRALSQDGIISPETDSGFIGSESSRVTPAAAPSPLQQRAAESVSVSLMGNSRCQQRSTPSQSHGGTAPRPIVIPPLALRQPRRSVQEPRRQNLSCSPRRWMRRATVNIHTESESNQSDWYTDSTDSLHTDLLSSSSSSTATASPFPAAPRHHGDVVAAPSSTQVPHCNNAIHVLQTEVIQLKERVERVLRSQKQSSPSSVQSSSGRPPLMPRFRSAERQSHIRQTRGTQTLDGEDEKRSAHGHEAFSRSELQSTPVRSHAPQTPRVSRATQTSAVVDARCSHVTVSSSRSSQHRQPPVMSVLTSEATDESDSRSLGIPPRGHHASRHRRSHHGGNRELSRSSTPSSHYERPGRYRRSHAAAGHTGHIPKKATRSGHVTTAVSPVLLPWQLSCPLLYSPPLSVSPEDSPLRVKGHRTRRSASADRSSVDDSLNRAIRAARHMKNTSRHMAHRLQAGLQHQQLLAESCSY